MQIRSPGAPESRLLTTKWMVPTPPLRRVSRPGLHALLKQGAKNRLLLLAAPAGSGKTTLLADWCRDPSQDLGAVRWLSLDPEDNEPIRFWSYFLAALGELPGGNHAALDSLQYFDSAPLEATLTALLNALSSATGDITFILDDYHVIDHPVIHEGIVFLLRHLPPRVLLVISSRTEPPFPLARLRARGHLAEVDAAQLRMSFEDTQTFLNSVMDLALEESDIHLLKQRTEGWVAGLQLAALSLGGRRDVHDLVAGFSGTNRFVQDYLSNEVLELQPPEILDFLCQTSILDRLSGPLCDAVTLQPGGQQRLEWLERHRLFTIPMDEERTWWRYHHLFAETLRNRLQRNAPDAVSGLHSRAADWLDHHGLESLAIPHALAAHDTARAVNLLERAIGADIEHGQLANLSGWVSSQFATFARWIQAIPDLKARSRPALAFVHAWGQLYAGDLEGAERLLDTVENRLEDGSQRDLLLSQTLALRAHIAGAYRWEPARGIALGQRALELMSPCDNRLRGMALRSLALAYQLHGENASAVQVLAEAVAAAEATGDRRLEILALGSLADAQANQGLLQLSAATATRAIERATDSTGRHLPTAAFALLRLSSIHREHNQLEEAQRLALEALALGRQERSTTTQFSAWSVLARILWARGLLDQALEALKSAEAFVNTPSLPHRSELVATLRARIWVAQGNLPRALGWATSYLSRVARAGSAGQAPRMNVEQAELGVARILALQGRPEDALKILERWMDSAEPSGRIERLIEMHLIQALAYRARNDLASAVTALQHAMRLGEPGNYLCLFAEEGAPMLALLRQAALQGNGSAYLKRLLAVFSGNDAPTSQARPLIEPLSPRELEILQCIADGLSNQDISEEIDITVGTVKWHIRNIFSKLNTRSRTESVARARHWNLL